MAMRTSAERAEELLSSPDIYRNGELIRRLAERIGEAAEGPLNIMEVCGGQTFALARYRLEEFLPEYVKMIHGPGCPVCVTPTHVIDMATALAERNDVTICSGCRAQIRHCFGLKQEGLMSESSIHLSTP